MFQTEVYPFDRFSYSLEIGSLSSVISCRALNVILVAEKS